MLDLDHLEVGFGSLEWTKSLPFSVISDSESDCYQDAPNEVLIMPSIGQWASVGGDITRSNHCTMATPFYKT